MDFKNNFNILFHPQETWRRKDINLPTSPINWCRTTPGSAKSDCFQQCIVAYLRIRRSLDARVHAFVTSRVDYYRLLQCNPRRGSEDNNRQVTTSVKRCCTSRQWHQEVWQGTVTTDAPGVTLAGHSRASEVQAGHAYPTVSARKGASVSIKLLHSSPQVATRRHLRSAARHQLTVPRHRLSTFGRRILLSLVRRCSTLCQMIYKIPQSAQQHSDNRWRHTLSLSISMFSALPRGVSRNALYKCTILTYLLWTLSVTRVSYTLGMLKCLQN